MNIDIADILGQKYRYCIDIGNGDIDPPLVNGLAARRLLAALVRHLASNRKTSI